MTHHTHDTTRVGIVIALVVADIAKALQTNSSLLFFPMRKTPPYLIGIAYQTKLKHNKIESKRIESNGIIVHLIHFLFDLSHLLFTKSIAAAAVGLNLA